MTRHDHKDQDQETNQSSSQPDPGLAGRLCIKLKIPNSKNMFLQDEQLKPVGNSRSGHRVCDICGKEFSSGKAWGGHKRHHLKIMKENLKKDQILKLKKPTQSSKKMGRCNMIKVGDVKIKGGKPVCCLCGKCFSSMKALFGHMKFHPDRDWTGTQPPLLLNNGTSSSSMNNQEPEKMCVNSATSVELLSLLAGWRKTDKRGKKCTCDPVYQAAMDLMKLSQDERGRTQQLNFAQDCRFENPAMIESDDDDKGFLRQELAKKMKKPKKKKFIAKLNNHDDYDELIKPGGFKCNNCGTSFSTFQGLGGHRSSCIVKKPEETLQGSDDNDKDEERDGNLFQCDVCNKSFSSGQALGGHKRIHWRPIQLKTQLVAIKREHCYDDDDDAETEVYSGKLGFDLNEPYVLQEDD